LYHTNKSKKLQGGVYDAAARAKHVDDQANSASCLLFRECCLPLPGPSFAVLLFSSASVPGVAGFRIASAAVVFAVWRRPWRLFIQMS